MSKPYDALFKDLLERDPASWVRLVLGFLPGAATVVDSDISTVSGAADKVVLLDGPAPAILHFEAFASWDDTLPARALFYNAAHHRRHALPVDTVLVLMRPEADHRSLTGEHRVVSPLTGRAHSLEYGVLRAWRLDLNEVLRGPLALLPLAVVTEEAQVQLPKVLQRIRSRVEREAGPEERKDLMADTFVLLGLRHTDATVAQLFGGTMA